MANDRFLKVGEDGVVGEHKTGLVAGEALAKGDVVRFSDTGKLVKAQASEIAKCRDVAGIVAEAADDQAAVFLYTEGEVIPVNGSLEINTVYFLSASAAGALQTTVAGPGEVILRIGRSDFEKKFYVKISDPIIRNGGDAPDALPATVSFDLPDSLTDGATGITFSGTYANLVGNKVLRIYQNDAYYTGYAVAVSGSGNWEVAMTGVVFAENKVWSVKIIEGFSTILCTAPEMLTVGAAPAGAPFLIYSQQITPDPDNDPDSSYRHFEGTGFASSTTYYYWDEFSTQTIGVMSNAQGNISFDINNQGTGGAVGITNLWEDEGQNTLAATARSFWLVTYDGANAWFRAVWPDQYSLTIDDGVNVWFHGGIRNNPDGMTMQQGWTKPGSGTYTVNFKIWDAVPADSAAVLNNQPVSVKSVQVIVP